MKADENIDLGQEESQMFSPTHGINFLCDKC